MIRELGPFLACSLTKFSSLARHLSKETSSGWGQRISNPTLIRCRKNYSDDFPISQYNNLRICGKYKEWSARLVVGFRVIKLARYLLVYSSIMLNSIRTLEIRRWTHFCMKMTSFKYWQNKSNMCRLSPFPMRSIVLWCVRRTASGLHLWTTERPTVLNQMDSICLWCIA
jgi:hypothetical protein